MGASIGTVAGYPWMPSGGGFPMSPGVSAVSLAEARDITPVGRTDPYQAAAGEDRPVPRSAR
jgi:hypothetical protein